MFKLYDKVVSDKYGEGVVIKMMLTSNLKRYPLVQFDDKPRIYSDLGLRTRFSDKKVLDSIKRVE